MKPLNKSVYGSIAHLPESKLGIGDKRIHEGQAKICWEKSRKGDLIIVQEKLDGSCVSIAKHNGEILALTRAGYLASSSQYEQHRMFDSWVDKHKSFFRGILNDDERLVGEWLAQAHGTKYIIDKDPIVFFDLFNKSLRIPWSEFTIRTKELTTPYVFYSGENSFSKEKMLQIIKDQSKHKGERIEGVIYRVYHNGVFDFAAKYVRGDYIPGKYLPELNPNIKEPIWNWKEK